MSNLLVGDKCVVTSNVGNSYSVGEEINCIGRTSSDDRYAFINDIGSVQILHIEDIKKI